ncbi:uncharacterized protein PgNI_07983 [Pyricularia grisea]|uniref:Uncharacterized protein n=1 Tax=Pyricularia grisea TaxID=148305 RepID=A0A6P8B1L4_PYRGI|nr:uncharacterized protein PgNI_07983 [Pyricularia grisea]TLD08747.1 hypothetical protein PgNI_07983 [Pyricularia grisea]
MPGKSVKFPNCPGNLTTRAKHTLHATILTCHLATHERNPPPVNSVSLWTDDQASPKKMYRWRGEGLQIKAFEQARNARLGSFSPDDNGGGSWAAKPLPKPHTIACVTGASSTGFNEAPTKRYFVTSSGTGPNHARDVVQDMGRRVRAAVFDLRLAHLGLHPLSPITGKQGRQPHRQ